MQKQHTNVAILLVGIVPAALSAPATPSHLSNLVRQKHVCCTGSMMHLSLERMQMQGTDSIPPTAAKAASDVVTGLILKLLNAKTKSCQKLMTNSWAGPIGGAQSA